MSSQSSPAPRLTMPRQSLGSLPNAKASGSGVFRQPRLEPQTDTESSSVITASFGEWPKPHLEHPDSVSISDFVAQLTADGHGATLEQGRKSISDWIDPRPSIRALRLKAGLSQAMLAAKMKTSQPQIARMESGKQDIQLSSMKALAAALGVDLHVIVDALNA